MKPRAQHNRYTNIDPFNRFMDSLPAPKNTGHAMVDYRILVAILLQLPLLIPIVVIDRLSDVIEARRRRRGVRPRAIVP